MHPVRKQRLIFALFIVFFATLAIGLVSYALRDSINLFYPPAKIASGEAPVDKSIRAGGCVEPGSVKRSNDSLKVTFLVTDGIAKLKIKYEGILPDLFAEGEAVVVNGRLDTEGVFQASQVLAKHDENYTPPEVAEAIAQKEGAQHSLACKDMKYDT